MAKSVDVSEFIDAAPFGALQKIILTLCFLVVAIDGFDTAVVGFLAPAIAAEWGIGPKELTPMMMAGLLGLMAGSLLLGPLSDRRGRKPILIFSTMFFGAMCLAAGFTKSIETLTLLRFLTGLGLGAALPCSITLTSEFCPNHRRASLVTLMFCGFAVGMASAGIISTSVIPLWGWQGVLMIGGIAPLLLVPVLLLGLRESPRFLALKGDHDREISRTLARIGPVEPDIEFVAAEPVSEAPVRQLFSDGLGLGTLLLWATFLMSLLIIYLVGNWMPTLLTEQGASREAAGLIATGFPLGGAVGAIVLGQLMDRFDENRVLAVSYVTAAVFITIAGTFSASLEIVAFCVFAAGFCITGGQVGINALASGFYPTAARATGVSWANGVGRAGSIFGSLFGGVMLSLGWGISTVFALIAIPAIFAGISIFLMGNARKEKSGPPLKRRGALLVPE